MVCEMDDVLAEVSSLPIMGNGRRWVDPKCYKGRAAAISAWGAGRHIWEIWAEGVQNLVNRKNTFRYYAKLTVGIFIISSLGYFLLLLRQVNRIPLT